MDDIRTEVIKTVQKEYETGLVTMYEGNASARVGDRVYITPSHVAKPDLTEDMIIETDLQGNILKKQDGLKASSELMMHLEVYHLRSDVKAIVHNHSVFTTAFAIDGLDIQSDALTEINLTFGKIPCIPYGRPGTPRIYEHFKDYLKDYPAVLLANHGLLTFGKTLREAYSMAEAAENIAKTLYVAGQLGMPSNISPEELKKLRK